MPKLSSSTFLPGTLAEWTGVYVFGVGVFGGTYRSTTRHLTLFGVVPLDWFYFVLLSLGAALMLFGGPRSALAIPTETTLAARFFGGLRVGITVTLLVSLGWWSIGR